MKSHLTPCGTTADSPRAEVFVILGFDFWPDERAKPTRYAPSSLQSQ
jgi:hypothetical protein